MVFTKPLYELSEWNDQVDRCEITAAPHTSMVGYSGISCAGTLDETGSRCGANLVDLPFIVRDRRGRRVRRLICEREGCKGGGGWRRVVARELEEK